MTTEINFAGFATIAAAARAARPAPSIKREDVTKVYIGKANKPGGCACGCRGDYFYTSFAREEAKKNHGDVDDRKAVGVVERMEAALDYVRAHPEASCLELETGNRTFRIYVREGADLSGFEVGE